MLTPIRYEAGKIFGSRLNRTFFIVFVLFALTFIISGIYNYNSFQEEKRFFQEYERSKVKQYVTYSQYGGYGFRVLYEPPPLSLFFNNSMVFQNLYSNVDLTELVKLNNSYKGKNLFQKPGLFKDFSGLVFLFGSLFMLIMGIGSYKGKKLYYGFRHIVIRFLLLLTTFYLITWGLYLLSTLAGPMFTPLDTHNFFFFSLYILVFLSFFFIIGLLMRLCIRNRAYLYIFAVIFWFISVSGIPELQAFYMQSQSQRLSANEKYNITKLDRLMEMEKQMRKTIEGIKDRNKIQQLFKEKAGEFFETGYKDNREIENDISRGIRSIVYTYGTISLFYPTMYYQYLSGELSGKGYNGYLDFTDYILNLRHEFVRFYLKKRYESNDRTVESFVKNSENIYMAGSTLPGNFPMGIFLNILYVIGLFLLAAWALRVKMRRKAKPSFQFDLALMQTGETYFFHCAGAVKKDEIINFMESKGAAIIRKLDLIQYDPGVSLRFWLDFQCKNRNIEVDDVIEKLELMDVSPFDLNKKIKVLGEEAFNKAYLALQFSGKQDIMVLDDFIKKETRTFELQFLKFLEVFGETKVIVYLSGEMYMSASKIEEELKSGGGFEIYQIEPSKVSLR
jgi:hypothetical protein